MSGDLDGGDDGDLLRPDAPELRALLSRVSRERQVQKDEIASLVELKQELGEHHAAFISVCARVCCEGCCVGFARVAGLSPGWRCASGF